MTQPKLKAPSPQQEKFARGVASGLSQAEAYRQAYPRSQKWKNETVHQQASRLMRLPHVAARTKAIQEVVAEKTTLKAAAILDEIRRLAQSDIGSIMHEDGKMKLPHELDADTRAAVASFEMDEYGRIKYKFWDKNAAIEKAAKHLGLYEIDNKQKSDGLADLLGRLNGNIHGVVTGPSLDDSDDNDA